MVSGSPPWQPPAERRRVVIVGAGIFGLAHAWQAARAGHQVTVLERNAATQEATTRNFGMIWPIGQPQGPRRALAMESRRWWLELAQEAGFWIAPCGSLHLAHHDDEWQLLQEFIQLETSSSPAGETSALKLIDAQGVAELTPAASPSGLRGALYSASECAVNPRTVPGKVKDFLQDRWKVEFQFDTPVVEVTDNSVRTASRTSISFDVLIVASGSELRLLFPELLASAGLKTCKLQMLRTVAQPDSWRLGPHLASGLTLRHYKAFEACPMLRQVRQRFNALDPRLDEFGIHVMASQNEYGEVILGDSHEYDEDIQPFDRTVIDQIILRELQKIIRLPDWTIEQRWSGIYVKHPSKHFVWLQPRAAVHVMTGLGGAGMTLSQGIAARFWQGSLEESGDD